MIVKLRFGAHKSLMNYWHILIIIHKQEAIISIELIVFVLQT